MLPSESWAYSIPGSMSDNRQSWSFLDTTVERSFLWSLALTLLPVISAFGVSWVIARFSGPTTWGIVSWTMALATALLIVAKLGLDLGASRIASEVGVKQPGMLRPLFRTALTLRLLTTLSVAALTFLFAPQIARWLGEAALATPVRLGAGVVVCASVYEFQEQFLVGLNRHGLVSRVRSLALSLRVVATVAVVAAGLGAATILGGYLVAWLVGIVVFAVLLHRYLPPAQAGAKGALRRRLLRISVPLAVSSASVTIYSQIDKLMLGYFDTVTEVGQYSIARAVVEVSLFPSFAFVMTLRPALASRYSRGEIGQCGGLIADSLRLSLVSGVLFASLFAVLSVPLLQTVYSDSYGYAGELMVLFAGVLVLRSLGALILPALVAAERTSMYAWLTTGSAIANFGLNLLLIPAYHARGAIVATIVSYGALMGIGLWQVFRIFHVRFSAAGFGRFIRTVLAGIGAAGASWLILDQSGSGAGWKAVAISGLHAVLFLALVVAFRVVTPREVSAAAHKLLRTKG